MAAVLPLVRKYLGPYFAEAFAGAPTDGPAPAIQLKSGSSENALASAAASVARSAGVAVRTVVIAMV